MGDNENRDVERARRAAKDILAMSKGASLGGLKIKDLINEGRRELKEPTKSDAASREDAERKGS
jgi:hypothetical protein